VATRQIKANGTDRKAQRVRNVIMKLFGGG